MQFRVLTKNDSILANASTVGAFNWFNQDPDDFTFRFSQTLGGYGDQV